MIRRAAYRYRTAIALGVILAVWAAGAAAALAEDAMAFDGLLEPHLVVELGSEVPGVLDSVKVERGDMVKAGQVLATLRSGVEAANHSLAKARAQFDAAIKVKRASLEFAERNSQRTRELFDAKALAFQKWDEVETQRIMASNELLAAIEQKQLYELEYRQAEEVLKRKTILSPVSGVVMERYLAKGEYVENKPILKLAQIDPLNVEVVVPVAMIGFARPGMTATVRPEAPVGGEYKATVVIVDRVVDAASGTFGVRLKIPNPEHALPAGLKCKVLFHKP